MQKKGRSVPQLEDLSCFVGAAEHKSMTTAAAVIGMSQSTFSRQLARLEDCLGGRLLHRTGRGVEMSELGRRVLPRAKALINEAELLADDVSDRWSRPAGTVNVGLLPSMVKPLTSSLFANICERFPEVRLQIHEAYSGEIEVMLAEGRIDVGTLNRYRPIRNTKQDPLFSASMCLIASPKTLLGLSDSVRFSVLADYPLVMPLRPNSLRSVVEEIAERRQINLNIALEVGSSTAMKDAVTSSGLCATLPAHAVSDEVARAELVALPITHPPIKQTAFVESTRRRPASAAVRVVETLLKELVRGMPHC